MVLSHSSSLSTYNYMESEVFINLQITSAHRSSIHDPQGKEDCTKKDCTKHSFNEEQLNVVTRETN